MDRLTTEKPVKDMTMTELALNGCYIDKTGWARYRDYDTDIDARDFARKLLERYEPDPLIPEETGDLEELLFDELQYGALDHAGSLVALVYMMICSMAELRAHLAAYEDTGLEPEELDDFARQACIIRQIAGCKTLADCYKLAEEGRLIVRPGTVYQTDGVEIYESTVRKVIYDTGHFAFDEDAIGHSVWLTREAAEAALGGSTDD